MTAFHTPPAISSVLVQHIGAGGFLQPLRACRDFDEAEAFCERLVCAGRPRPAVPPVRFGIHVSFDLGLSFAFQAALDEFGLVERRGTLRTLREIFTMEMEVATGDPDGEARRAAVARLVLGSGNPAPLGN